MLTNILMLKLKGKLFTRVLRLIFGSSVIVKPCQDFSVKTALMLPFFARICSFFLLRMKKKRLAYRRHSTDYK